MVDLSTGITNDLFVPYAVNVILNESASLPELVKSSKFGSKCELSEDFVKRVDKLGITANVIDIAKAKETKAKRRKRSTKFLFRKFGAIFLHRG